MNSITATAPGKCILFGEHVVVYGYPAIAAAISLYSSCKIEPSSTTNQLDFKNYNQSFEFLSIDDLILKIPSRFKQISECLKIFNKKFNVSFNGIKITINSSLFPSSGLGSSASIAVALVAALNTFYKLNLTRETISEIAFEMEKIIHGTPSGIDNTTCTFGNLLFYQKGKHRFLKVPLELNLLITYTNIEHNTKQAIEIVRKKKDDNPDDIEEIFKNFEKVILSGEKALQNGDAKEIGLLMSDNQALLDTIGISNDIINKIIDIALKHGAYGSKLTGAGLGGCVISIGSKKKLEKISKILSKKGYESFITTIDREGVKIESSK